MNYKCFCVISFIFPSLSPPSETILSTAGEISTRLLKFYIPANIFLCFTILEAVLT